MSLWIILSIALFSAMPRNIISSLGSDQYFFVFRHDSKPSIETVRRHFIHYRDLAHIPDSFTFHCLRHTYAVNFLRAGGELYDLKYRPRSQLSHVYFTLSSFFKKHDEPQYFLYRLSYERW